MSADSEMHRRTDQHAPAPLQMYNMFAGRSRLQPKPVATDDPTGCTQGAAWKLSASNAWHFKNGYGGAKRRRLPGGLHLYSMQGQAGVPV